MSTNGRSNPSETQVENLDVFGMFGFPLGILQIYWETLFAAKI